MQVYRRALFIFRRDLRLEDNTALNAALQQSESVIAAFIFDPRQIDAHPYQSQPGLQFMLQALSDLQQQLEAQQGKLFIFKSHASQLISELRQETAFDAVFINRDYTPFSRQRDAEIELSCQQLGIDFHACADALLNEPEQLLKADGRPYQVFTPFYRRSAQNPVNAPVPLRSGHFVKESFTLENANTLSELTHTNAYPFQGGSRAAYAILDNLAHCQFYSEQRDFPVSEASSRLSAHLKFGCCSVRQAYFAVLQQLGAEHSLLRQFYWRDFFHHIAFHFPHVFGHAFDTRYDAIPWRRDENDFWRWANGQTGFPIVDAGMRQLNQTGYMHNRVRMITASFLTKDLHISWRWGERYFAQRLVDYDPCLNNGNWQWAASTGCDAQPYFRIFNPWLQQQKFDPDCRYIKQWIPELRDLSPKAIHGWQSNPLVGEYPSPMLNHSERSQTIKEWFKSAASVV